MLQTVIDASYARAASTEHALLLLRQFECLLQRDSFRADLDAKYLAAFASYAADLEAVQRLYEKHKGEPPLARNAPPVAGAIGWARALLSRIEAPMARFRRHEAVLAAKDSKRVIRTYNRLAQVGGARAVVWCRAKQRQRPADVPPCLFVQRAAERSPQTPPSCCAYIICNVRTRILLPCRPATLPPCRPATLAGALGVRGAVAPGLAARRGQRQGAAAGHPADHQPRDRCADRWLSGGPAPAAGRTGGRVGNNAWVLHPHQCADGKSGSMRLCSRTLPPGLHPSCHSRDA